MTYEPKEGVDYIIDLYAVAGAQPEADSEEIKRSLRRRMSEYHPDRLDGLAPEFRSKGERMVRLLNRARVILLDADKRRIYDDVLNEWDGLTSTDGTPVIRADTHLQREMEGKTLEDIEAIFTDQARQIEGMSGHSLSRIAFLEKMVEQSGADVPYELRVEYEDALLIFDRALAIQESERSRLLGLPDIGHIYYTAGLNYTENVSSAIEAAREVRLEELKAQAIGGVSVRLALLAGEELGTTTTDIVPSTSTELPAYFDQQAEKVREIAVQRQELVEKRLANFIPNYPESELQSEAKPNLAIGVGVDAFKWFCVAFDPETKSAELEPMQADIANLLNDYDFKAAIERGYNVLTFAPLEQIAIIEQLIEAIEKHAAKYGIIPKD